MAAMLLQTAIQARQLSSSTELLDRQQLLQHVLQQIGAGDTPMIATLKLQVCSGSGSDHWAACRPCLSWASACSCSCAVRACLSPIKGQPAGYKLACVQHI